MATVASNWALQYVPYPTQVIGKTVKPIPVMLLGVLIGRKSYPIQRYLIVFAIVAGVIMFMLEDIKKKTANFLDDDDKILLGQLLLLLSLSMDGFTGGIQDRINGIYSPTAKHMMFSINAFSTVFLFIAVIARQEIFDFIAFATRYPFVIWQLALLAFTGSIGQLFIFIMVSSFGSLACSIVTTTRKFFTVLFSVLCNNNPLTLMQWISTAVVFLALFADAFFGRRSMEKEYKKVSVDINKVIEEGKESHENHSDKDDTELKDVIAATVRS